MRTYNIDQKLLKILNLSLFVLTFEIRAERSPNLSCLHTDKPRIYQCCLSLSTHCRHLVQFLGNFSEIPKDNFATL